MPYSDPSPVRHRKPVETRKQVPINDGSLIDVIGSMVKVIHIDGTVTEEPPTYFDPSKHEIYYFNGNKRESIKLGRPKK